MIKVTEKSAKSFTRIAYKMERSCWNLYNPNTGKLLRSSDLKELKHFPFTERPDSWDKYGVIDASGVDWEQNLIWLKRCERYFDEGYYLCTGGDRAICDLLNWGFDIDDKGNVISYESERGDHE